MSRLMAAAAACWAAGLVWLTLHGLTGGPGGSPWVIAGPENVLADVVANVVAFLPLGALLVGAGLRARRAIAVILALTAAIELLQGLFVPGRYAALSDVLANTAGGALGGWLASNAERLLRPTRAEAIRLVGGWGVALAIALAVTLWLFEPGAPSRAYEGQHAEDWNRDHDPVHAVQRARFNGETYAWGIMPRPAVISAALADDDVRLEVLVDPGEVAPGVRRIAAVIAADPAQATVARLETGGHDLRFASRVRAERLGLHAPFARLAAAVPSASSASRSPLILGGARAGSRLSVWARGDTGAVRQAGLTLTPIDAWMFVAPPTLAARVPVVVSRALMLLLLLGPLVPWLAAAARTPRDTDPDAAEAAD